MDGSGDTSAMLGLDGFVVLVTTEEEDELFVLVETKAREVGCPSCGVVARGHGRSLLQVRDLPIGGRPVRLLWRKRRFLCAEELCLKRSFSEHNELVEDCLTRRAAKEICRRVGEEGHSVASLAREFGIGWWRAMAAVRRHGEPLVEDPARLEDVTELGVDEHKMLSASRRRNTFYATSFVDIERGRLLDVVPGRSGDDVAYWLYEAGPAWRSRIGTVAIDPHRGYANGLLRYLEKATVTIDHFHAVKLANEAINDARRRVQNDTLGRRGRRDDPLYRTRRLMTRAFERLSEHQRQRLFAALSEGDPAGEVSAAILGKELLRDTYAADSLEDGRQRLERLLRPRRGVRREGAHPARQDRARLGDRDPQLPPHRRSLQRCHRGPEPRHREDPSHRPRVQEFPELPAASLAALRSRMGHSSDSENQRSSTTAGRVEPLTVEEAAKVLGISRTFAYEAVQRGEIPSIRIGKRILVPKSRLERFLAGDGPPEQSAST